VCSSDLRVLTPACSQILRATDGLTREKLLIKKAELTQGRLMFVVEAFRALRDDDHFLTLLCAEGLDTLPTYLGQSLDAGATE